MLFEGHKETRGLCVCVPELFHTIWFWGVGYAVSRSILHHSLLLKAHLQRIIVPFEGPEETRGARVLVLDIFHIIWFWEGSAVSRSVLHHFLSLKARLQCIPM